MNELGWLVRMILIIAYVSVTTIYSMLQAYFGQNAKAEISILAFFAIFVLIYIAFLIIDKKENENGSRKT